MKSIRIALFAAFMFVFTALANAPVILGWTQSASQNVVSQKLYYSFQPVNPATGRFPTPTAVAIGNVSAYTLQNLPNGTYFMAVTAINNVGMESAYSNVITVALVPPAAPTALHGP